VNRLVKHLLQQRGAKDPTRDRAWMLRSLVLHGGMDIRVWRISFANRYALQDQARRREET
jgi:hypothetical protein